MANLKTQVCLQLGGGGGGGGGVCDAIPLVPNCHFFHSCCIFLLPQEDSLKQRWKLKRDSCGDIE